MLVNSKDKNRRQKLFTTEEKESTVMSCGFERDCFLKFVY